MLRQLAIRTTRRPAVALTTTTTTHHGVRVRSYTSTRHDNDPTTLEREKQRNLRKEQHKTSTPHHIHSPGWNEHLASDSEAHVKADRSTGSPQELQKETVDYVKKRHHDADSSPSPESSGARTVVKKKIHDEVTETVTESPQTPSEEAVKADRKET